MAKHIHIHFAPRRAVVADAVRRFLDQAPGSVPQGTTRDNDQPRAANGQFTAGGLTAEQHMEQHKALHKTNRNAASRHKQAASALQTAQHHQHDPLVVRANLRAAQYHADYAKFHKGETSKRPDMAPETQPGWYTKATSKPLHRSGYLGDSASSGNDIAALVDALHAAIAAREGAAPTQDADWDESAHPRGEGGKWTSGQHQVAAQRHEQLAGMHKASPVGQAHAKAAEAHQLAAHHLNTQTGWAEHHAAKAHQLSAAANQATSMTQTPEQLKAVAQDPKASVEERAAAVQQLDKMEKAANAVASSPHAVPKPAAPAMAHGANDPYRQSGGGEQMAHGGPQGAKPTKAVNTASTKAATHELLSTGHPFSIDELMAATGAKSKVTLMTALSDLKNPKYAGKLGNLEIVKRPDGMYHVAKAPAGGFTAPKPADTNAAPAAPQQPGAEASADPTAVASGSHPLSDYMPGQTLTAKGVSGKQYKVLGHNAAGNVVIQSPTGTKHHMEPAALKNATLPPPAAKPNAGAEQSKPDPVTGMPSGMVSPADREKIQAAQVKQASLTPKQAEKQDVEAALARPLDKPTSPMEGPSGKLPESRMANGMTRPNWENVAARVAAKKAATPLHPEMANAARRGASKPSNTRIQPGMNQKRLVPGSPAYKRAMEAKSGSKLGKSVGPASTSRLAGSTAESRMRAAAQGDRVPASAIFNHPAVDFPGNKMSLYAPGKEVHTNIPLSSIVPTDSSSGLKGIEHYMKTGTFGQGLPEVVKHGDKYILLDGHHRVASKIAKGHTHMPVKITGEMKK